MFTDLFHYYRRKHWNKLETELQENYNLLFAFAFPDYEDATLLAQVLSEVIQRSKNQDLKICLLDDFGKFIVLQLDPRECVELPGDGTGECMICLEELNEKQGCVYHRPCGHFVGHVQCFETWYKNPYTQRLKCKYCDTLFIVDD